MDTRAIAAEYRLSHWAGVIRERKASGLSVKAFCTNLGVHANSYYYWQKKLREAACGEMIKTQVESKSLSTVGFTEVKLMERTAQSAPTKSEQCHVSVESAGVRIVADGEYPADKLVLLLRELRWQSC